MVAAAAVVVAGFFTVFTTNKTRFFEVARVVTIRSGTRRF